MTDNTKDVDPRVERMAFDRGPGHHDVSPPHEYYPEANFCVECSEVEITKVLREAETQAFKRGFDARIMDRKVIGFKEAITKAAAVLRGKCDQYHCGHEDCNGARAIEKLTPDGGSEK